MTRVVEVMEYQSHSAYKFREQADDFADFSVSAAATCPLLRFIENPPLGSSIPKGKQAGSVNWGHIDEAVDRKVF